MHCLFFPTTRPRPVLRKIVAPTVFFLDHCVNLSVCNGGGGRVVTEDPDETLTKIGNVLAVDQAGNFENFPGKNTFKTLTSLCLL